MPSERSAALASAAAPVAAGTPIVELREATKVYGVGDAAVHALRGVDLRVDAGEALAIVGTSGSGKSTAMNLIGCLDQPSAGTCLLAGRETASLSRDERAALRNQVIGFVFQGFHLLPRTSAIENVELPLIYQGCPPAERSRRAREALERVGLGDRLHHLPNELSGGQQQRVAIARALVTRPSLLLADEPTGNLDTATSEDVLRLLESLHRDGLTVLVVTHEPDVAARFPRRVEFRDGRIVADSGPDGAGATRAGAPPSAQGGRRITAWGHALPLALRAVRRNKLRSALTTLGIVIGTAAVVGMLAIGRSARAQVQAQVATLGTNFLSVRGGSSGRGGVRWGAGSTNTLDVDDANAIARECPSVELVSPTITAPAQVKAGGANWSTMVEGVGEHYLDIRSLSVTSGAPLDPGEIRQGVKVCLLGPTVVRELFGGLDPVGAMIRVKNVPFRVKGVISARGESGWGQDQDDVILAPFPAVQRRLLGVTHVASIFVSARAEDLVEPAAEEIRTLLRTRHRLAPGQDDDFVVMTQTQMAQFAGGMFTTMSILLAGVACVSLLVGGIGIMNIMLVSVTERTREIGIRLAIGARGRDVLVQFLVEAVVISALGGLLGALAGAGIDRLISTLAGWPSGITPGAVVLAVGFSAVVGVFFGLFPARRAAALDPIVALRHE